MPRAPVPRTTVENIARVWAETRSIRGTAITLGLSRGTVAKYVRRGDPSRNLGPVAAPGSTGRVAPSDSERGAVQPADVARESDAEAIRRILADVAERDLGYLRLARATRRVVALRLAEICTTLDRRKPLPDDFADRAAHEAAVKTWNADRRWACEQITVADVVAIRRIELEIFARHAAVGAIKNPGATAVVADMTDAEIAAEIGRLSRFRERE